MFINNCKIKLHNKKTMLFLPRHKIRHKQNETKND